MNLLTKVAGALRAIANHPTNRNHRLKSVFKYGFVQIAARLVPGDVCVEFPNHTRLLVSPHMKGAAHYIMPRLCEFEEMAFVMHYLQQGDVFADVGANVGAFTIMAGGVAGAQVVAFEPSPDTYAMLTRNILLNNLHNRTGRFKRSRVVRKARCNSASVWGRKATWPPARRRQARLP